jgi:pimeloyl-ACP methyl ester carboxylesterase
VTGLPHAFNLLALGMLISLISLGIFLAYLVIRYGPVIVRIFEERPVFMPLKVTPEEQGQMVRFETEDGLRLAGSYLPRRHPERVGLLVFCHEYLSDRWSYFPYLDHLRDQGFDIFTFDYRNHGASDGDPAYSPLQWATDHEVRDLRAALRYLRQRHDHDSAGFGLFGVSRGGSTALVVGSEECDVWGVVTDGAFPTRGTMTAYILRWAEIYVRSRLFLATVPRWVYAFVGDMSRLRSQSRRNCRFPDIETAARRLSPRPLLMIHGERDTYIGPEIAMRLFDHAREPRELWIVPGAKHNRCRECQPMAYEARIARFMGLHAPRQAIEPSCATEAPAPVPEFAVEPALAVGHSKLMSNVPA